MCRTPGCAYTSPRKNSWYCTLTKNPCVAAPEIKDNEPFELDGENISGHSVSFGSKIYNERLAKQCPGYNLPQKIGKLVKLFRKKGTPQSLQEKAGIF